METSGNWTDLVGGVGLQMAEVHNQAMDIYKPGISALLITEGVSGVGERNFTGKTGSGRLQKFDGDGENIGSTRRYKTYTTKELYTNYGRAIEVSRNLLEDRDFGPELDEMKDLTVGGNFSKDESGMQLFNGGFSTNTSVNTYNMTWYGDGKPLFSTVHPTTVPGGSTQSNASSTGISFGDDNLETGKLAMTLQQTDDGFPLSLLGQITVVTPIALEKQAKQVLESDKVSENANNNINVYKGGGISLATSMFLDSSNGGSDTAWSLIVPGRTSLYQVMRREFNIGTATNIRNMVATFTIDARWANISREWKRSWGSKGDGVAYSS